MEIRKVSNSELKELKIISKESVDFKDNGCTQYLGAFVNGKIIGCVGWQIVGKSVLRYKTDAVLKEYSKKGVYTALWKAREDICKGIQRKRDTAFCTPMSLSMYVSKKFHVVSKKGKISFVER